MDNHAKSNAIAKALSTEGFSWNVVKDENNYTNWYELTRSDGLKLSLRYGDYNNKGRVVVRGSLAREHSQHMPRRSELNTSITCSEERTAEAIAGDITRRLLPDWEKYAAICESSYYDKVQSRAKIASYKAQLKHLAPWLSVTGLEQDHSDNRLEFYYNGAAYMSGNIYQYHGENQKSFDVNISSLSPSQFLELISLVGSWNNQKEANNER